jgi:hypothetical protein
LILVKVLYSWWHVSVVQPKKETFVQQIRTTMESRVAFKMDWSQHCFHFGRNMNVTGAW